MAAVHVDLQVEAVPQKKAVPFTPNEDAIMLEVYKNNKDTIDAPLSSKIKKQDKDAIWEQIATSVSAIGISKRTKEDCRKRLKNIKQNAKGKAAEERKSRDETGGGPGIFMTQAEAIVAEIFEDDPSFIGLNGVQTGVSNASASKSRSQTATATVRASTADKSLPSASAAASSSSASSSAAPVIVTRAINSTSATAKPIEDRTVKEADEFGAPTVAKRKFISVLSLQDRVLERQLQVANVQLVYYRMKIRKIQSSDRARNVPSTDEDATLIDDVQAVIDVE